MFKYVKAGNNVFTIDDGDCTVTHVTGEGEELKFKAGDTWYRSDGREYPGQKYKSCYWDNPFASEKCPLPVGTDQLFYFWDDDKDNLKGNDEGYVGFLEAYYPGDDCKYKRLHGSTWMNCRKLTNKEMGF